MMRQRHLRSRAELPLEALKMSRGEPVIETVFAGLRRGCSEPLRNQAQRWIADSRQHGRGDRGSYYR